MTAEQSGPPAADTPAAALGPAWDLLDALPRAAAPTSLTATTVEMVAAAARPRPARRGWWVGGLAPAAVVGLAFLVGLVAGRASLPDAERSAAALLPVLEHFDVVREAGSVEFLAAVARRDYPPPRRLPFGAPGDRAAAVADYPALDAAVAAFAGLEAGKGRPEPAERRTAFAARPADERRRLAAAAEDFQRLPAERKRDAVRLAQALGGGEAGGRERDELIVAARLWHQWLATRDPAERRGVIDLETDERLEWLDRYARMWPGPGRGPGRDGGFRGFPRPGFPRPDGPPPNGPPLTAPPPRDPRSGPPPPGEIPGPPR